MLQVNFIISRAFSSLRVLSLIIVNFVVKRDHRGNEEDRRSKGEAVRGEKRERRRVESYWTNYNPKIVVIMSTSWVRERGLLSRLRHEETSARVRARGAIQKITKK